MKHSEDIPHPFLEVIIHNDSPLPGLTGLCAGFENGKWRDEDFAKHLFRWLPEFALKYSESESLNKTNAVEKLEAAALNIFKSKKFESRGEFGELLLHAIIRQVFKTVPAISKIFYKDGPNDTVKGFDAVHVVCTDSDLELWLGEVKFYKSITKAITDVLDELDKHTKTDYLRTEFSAITNKIDDSWPHADKLKRLLHSNTSLDTIFTTISIPVLLTYDSLTCKKHTCSDQAYKDALKAEFVKHHNSFQTKLGASKLKVHLFLLPLNTKKDLIDALEKKLRIWQQI